MEDEKKNRIMTECWGCKFNESVPWNAHIKYIKCTNPDPKMTGSQWGISHGWFYYPFLFDPTWKRRLCANFQSKEIKPNEKTLQKMSEENSKTIP